MFATIDDFVKLEIRIGTVLRVERVDNSEKLLKFQFDFGDHQRQVLAGLGPWFSDPSVLVGKQVPVIVNLEPRTMAGLESQGMILATDDAGGPVLLHPEHPVPAGSKIR